MAHIVRPAAFHKMAWKNGGGITHEIARAEDDVGLLWRLSLAEVSRDGPFSLFRGMTRILTVIEGAGMELRTASETLRALPLSPVCFSGDWAVVGLLIDGPVSDFNLIFDSKRCKGAGRILRGPVELSITSHFETSVLGLAGCVLSDDEIVPPGAIALGKNQTIALAFEALALVTEINKA